jgi:glycosyltransferase involved in cell wall biosynthesis
MPRFLRAADVIIAVSECTRRDAVRLYGIDQAKIRVVYEGVNPRFRPLDDREQLEALRHRYALPARFLLYVGTIEPRKNLPALFEAFKQIGLPGVKLVIVGKKGWLYDETFARLQALGLEREVVFTGFVPDDDLPGLYTLAEAFVFPSLYEGFGLPVLEAMACGTPVITGNVSSLPEVMGDAGILVAPGDVGGLVTALKRVLTDSHLRAQMSAKGLAQARKFTWEKAAQETLAVYRRVMQST